MDTKPRHLISVACLATAVALCSSVVAAGPRPMPVHSNAFGGSYAEHAESWLEWAMSIPAATSPFLDTDGSYAAVGQQGKVWYLAGNFGGTTERTITVPTGKAVFLPVLNAFWVNTPEYGDAPWSEAQEAFAQQAVAALVDTATDFALEIDGKPVANIADFRVLSTTGSCNLPPTDNVFGVPLEPVPHECLADGYWALLPPMSVGMHTVHFRGSISANGFSLDVTYYVNVKPRHKAGEVKAVPH